jgi:hypothetical protein
LGYNPYMDTLQSLPKSIKLFLWLAVIQVIITVSLSAFGFSGFKNTFMFKDWSEDPILAEKITRPIKHGEEFVIHNDNGDQIQYLRMAIGKPAIAPFKFRVIYPYFIAGVISVEKAVLGDKLASIDDYRLAYLNFWFFNLILFIFAAHFLFKLITQLTDNPYLIFGSLIFFVSQFAIIHIVPTALLDVAGLFVFNAVLYWILTRNWIGLFIMLALAVLVKDFFVIFTPALCLLAFRTKEYRFLLLSLLPIAVFLLSRHFWGGNALSVHYDWDLSKGEFHWGLLKEHVGSLKLIVLHQLPSMLMCFGTLWVYIRHIGVLKHIRMFEFYAALLVLMLAAQLTLSAEVIRILSPVLPIFIIISILHIKKGLETSP